MPPKSVRKKNESLNLEQEVSIKIEWMYYHFEYKHTFTCLMLYTIVELGEMDHVMASKTLRIYLECKRQQRKESKSHHFNIKH